MTEQGSGGIASGPEAAPSPTEESAAGDAWKSRHPNTCPLCVRSSIAYVTDCYDKAHTKICELWFCQSCGGFFPRQLDVKTLRPEPRPVSMTNPRPADPPPGGEKRRAPRFPVQFVVQVDFDHAELPLRRSADRVPLSEPLVAMVIDAGTGGLCFRYPEAIEEGREGRMKISLPSVSKSFFALGRVVRSTRLPDGSWGLGVEFIDVDPEYRDALRRYVSLS